MIDRFHVHVIPTKDTLQCNTACGVISTYLLCIKPIVFMLLSKYINARFFMLCYAQLVITNCKPLITNYKFLTH